MCGMNNMRIYIELASYQPVFKLSSYFQLASKNDNDYINVVKL